MIGIGVAIGCGLLTVSSLVNRYRAYKVRRAIRRVWKHDAAYLVSHPAVADAAWDQIMKDLAK